MKKYLKSYPLKDNELTLFTIVISIPPIINFEGNEITITRTIREKLDYIFKTEKLVLSLKPKNAEDK